MTNSQAEEILEELAQLSEFKYIGEVIVPLIEKVQPPLL